jgi:hypothetical protein
MKVIYINDLTSHRYLVEKPEGQDTLSFLQSLVEGLIESVSLTPDTDVWVNEEGLFRNDFVSNIGASLLAGRTLVGPAVLTGHQNGETVGFPERYWDTSHLQQTYTAEEVIAIRKQVADALIKRGELVSLYGDES